MELIALAVVALIALSPVGEILLAIPAGVAMNLPLLVVVPVALAANLLPLPVLLYLIGRTTKYPRINNWLLKHRSERVGKWMNKYGTVGLFLLTPWIGVYAATVACKLLGMKESRLTAAIAASLVFYSMLLAFSIMLV